MKKSGVPAWLTRLPGAPLGSRLATFALAGLALCGQFTLAERALAQDRVLLVADSKGQHSPGLGHALRIQLSGIAEVLTPDEALPGDDLAARVAAAGRLAEARAALLVAWVDQGGIQPDGSRQVVIYAVGRRDGRAVLEVVRVPGGSGPHVDRALALKLREVVDVLRAARDQGQESLLAPAPPPRPLALVGGVGLEVSGLARSDLGQWAGRATLGAEWVAGAAALRVGGGLAIAPSVELARADQRVRVSELTPQALLVATLAVGPLRVGAGGAATLAWVQAEGVTVDGERGARSLTIPSLRGHLLLEWRIGRRFALALELGIEGRLERHQLEVAGVPVADLGRVRPRGGLEILLR